MSIPTGGKLPDLIRLDRPVLIVGRDPRADVRLPHPAVSRRHAELRPDGDGVLVRDLGSRAGVFVNRVAVPCGRLAADDVVGFGPVGYELKGGCLRLVTRTDGVAVAARGLTVRRGARAILSSVNLSVPANNFVGILGPSGAGKTTLLKGVTGFLRDAEGQVCFDGLDLAVHRETCRSMVGFVPQEDVVHLALTARENLDFGLRLRVAGDLRPEERAAWVGSALRRLGLENDADRPVRTLSGGQRKRVNVAIELLSRPRLLLLDEPTAGLDPATEARLMGFLRDLSRRGTTVVCTTHVMESLALFDAVVVVAGGRVLGSGNPGNLLGHFKVHNYAELYEKLEKVQPADPGGKSAGPAGVPGAGRTPRQPAAATSVLNQILVQFMRGFAVTARDRALVALLIGQPLLIAFLIGLSQYEPSFDDRLNLFYTFAVVASIWLGLNNTAREVVRDRTVYVRERRTMLRPESYLLAKVAQFACIGLAQIVLMALWLRFCTFMDGGNDAYKSDLQNMNIGLFILILWITYLSGMLLGLLISALAPTEEVAVAVLPLVILPQLLLSGAAANMASVNMPAGRFNSLPVMVQLAREAKPADPTHPAVADWGLVSASLLTYSRPALVFFLYYKNENPQAPPDPTLKALIDWGHLLFLLLATATAFVAVFLRRERRWLEAS